MLRALNFFMLQYLIQNVGIDELLMFYCLFEMFNDFDFLCCIIYFQMLQ
jgi:hypothetical protein